MLDYIGDIRLSSEQMIGVWAACNPENRLVKIESPAGSGKSLLTEAIIRNMDEAGKVGRGLAFNRSAAKNMVARGLPESCAFSTYHGMAYKFLTAAQKKRVGNLNAWAVQKALNLTYFAGANGLTQAYAILNALDTWCRSGDHVLEIKHVTGDTVDVLREKELLNVDFIARVRRNAILLWNEVWKKGSELPIPHDFYLKQWVRKTGDLGLDYVVVDEAQDLNPVILGWLRRQSAKIILIGDSNQQIYSWRGAVDALQSFEFDEDVWLTRSYRFGQEVADVAMSILADGLSCDRVIEGNPDVSSVVHIGADDRYNAFLSRYNSSLYTKLMEEDCPIRIVGAANAMRHTLKSVVDLQSGKKCSHELLSPFSSWDEVISYAENQNDGDLKRLVKSVSLYGADTLLRAFEQKVVDEGNNNYELTLATAHASKGMEFEEVRLADDFPGLIDSRKEEVRLLYVAVTRAQNRLSIPANVPIEAQNIGKIAIS